MRTNIDGLQFKTIKVSAKGQITLPVDIQKEIGIEKGDELLLVRKGKKIMLEKHESIASKIDDDFTEIQKIAESSLKKIWLNKSDDIWNSYLK